MSKKPQKRRFEVEEHETVAECLERMKKEGYEPVRRIEKPIFREVIGADGEITYEPVKKQIVFEGRLQKNNP